MCPQKESKICLESITAIGSEDKKLFLSKNFILQQLEIICEQKNLYNFFDFLRSLKDQK